jgi:hypothetical protein
LAEWTPPPGDSTSATVLKILVADSPGAAAGFNAGNPPVPEALKFQDDVARIVRDAAHAPVPNIANAPPDTRLVVMRQADTWGPLDDER